jgi:tetrahydromethanopterin S-methyltransferase subunit B
MSMTPFEIRLELLKMSKDLLVSDFDSKKESLIEQWQTEVESAKISGITSPVYPALPSFPTEEDIVKKAEVLNNFVSQTTPVETKPNKKSN